ncbi:hypothetical protein ACK3YL_12910 [Aeromonas caviae]|uniref:hypothetical protein n=1 Tax=Aeromonas hydrophila TaxID=644 RepID=UPI0039F6BBBF
MYKSTFSDRIERMKKRRKGSIEQIGVAQESYSGIAMDGLENYGLLENVISSKEEWELRGKEDNATRYVIGAMQPVESQYTKVSLQTAERIENQLEKRLIKHQLDFRLQGSVALDIHIKGFSDVDLLIIDKQMLMYDRDGVRKNFYTPTSKKADDVILTLRNTARDELKKAFPEANVDDENNKSLRVTGGSLQREVDVVPAIWWDNCDYQLSQIENERGVMILHRDTREYIYNAPFVHIKRIEDKCNRTNGGLRKSIRLLKTIKADNQDEGIEINLSSYDIASLMYHADENNLRHNTYYELAVLTETHRWLNYLCTHPDEAKKLDVPNGTRRILENDSSLDELAKLTHIVNGIVNDVIREVFGDFDQQDTIDKSALLKSTQVL